MQCPVCKVNLVMSDRQGVEIDYCPQCRGVWLDRGELDKIIERSTSADMPHRASTPGYINDTPRHSEHHGEHHEGHGHGEHEYYKKKKREGLLGDLFDF